jgi:hypothetical protein
MLDSRESEFNKNQYKKSFFDGREVKKIEFWGFKVSCNKIAIPFLSSFLILFSLSKTMLLGFCKDSSQKLLLPEGNLGLLSHFAIVFGDRMGRSLHSIS